MNCEAAEELIPLYHDGELNAVQAASIEGHLAECSECQQSLSKLRVLTRAIQTYHDYQRVPSPLERSIRQQTGRRPLAPIIWSIPFAAGLAAGVALILFWPKVSDGGFAKDLVASHVHSLMTSSLIDVHSSDRHTVKPWFQGKLSFSPTVLDLKDDGFVLRGGRLEFLDGLPTAAIVYNRGLHVINLYVIPRRSEGPKTLSYQGFHCSEFTLGDLDYWAVSDLNQSDLDRFAADYQRLGDANTPSR